MLIDLNTCLETAEKSQHCQKSASCKGNLSLIDLDQGDGCYCHKVRLKYLTHWLCQSKAQPQHCALLLCSGI